MPGDHEIERVEQPAGPLLGDVLYANAQAPVPESEWSGLVRQVAAGDQESLHRLYERAARLVHVLALRITRSRESAEEVTVAPEHARDAVPDLVVPSVGANNGCPAGSGACDDDPGNGCETNTETTVDHSGGCGNA